jgi:probable phosphoglycerate mutase
VVALVARHGETTWNLAGRYQGRRESALSALGVRQGIALAHALASFSPRLERIISSPLLRCTATARFVAERLNLAVQTDERLIEIGHGDWEGRLRDEIARNDPERWYLWKNESTKAIFSDGDSILKVAERWRAFTAEPCAAPTLIVTHDAVVRAALCIAQEKSLDAIWTIPMENAAYACFEVDAGTWRLTEPLVNAHLTGLRADVTQQAL